MTPNGKLVYDVDTGEVYDLDNVDTGEVYDMDNVDMGKAYDVDTYVLIYEGQSRSLFMSNVWVLYGGISCIYRTVKVIF